MSNIFRRRHRKTKTFISSYLAAVFPGYVLSMMAAILLNQENLPTWETNIYSWISVLIVGIIVIGLFYYFRKKKCSDPKDKNNFHNSFMINIITAIPIICFIIYNSVIPFFSKNWWIALLIFIIYTFISAFIYVKFSKDL